MSDSDPLICWACGAKNRLPAGTGTRPQPGASLTLRCARCGDHFTVDGLELVLELAAPAGTVAEPEAAAPEAAVPAPVTASEPSVPDQVVSSEPPVSEPVATPKSAAESAESAAGPEVSGSAPPGAEKPDGDGPAVSWKFVDSADSSRAPPVEAESDAKTAPVGPVSGPVIDYKEMEEPPPSSWEYDPVSQVEIVESGPRAVPVPLRSLPAVKAETKPFTDELPPESRPAQEPIEPLPPSSGTPDLRSLTIKYGESEEDEKEENGPPSWYARLQQQPSISSMLPGHLTEPPHPAALSTSPVTADEGELAKPDTEARGTSAAPAEAPTALRRVARMALPFVAGAGLVLGGYSLSSLRSRQEPGAQNEAPAAPPSLEKVRASETPPVSTTVETSPSVAASAPAMASASSAGRPSDQKVATESRPGDKPRPTDSPSAAAKPAAPASAEKPAEAAPAPEAQKTGPDTTAVKAALSQGATLAQACRKEGEPPGSGVVQVTFAPSGRVTRAIMQGPPFGGTATGSCIANKLRSLSIPPYSGDPVTVSKTITLQ